MKTPIRDSLIIYDAEGKPIRIMPCQKDIPEELMLALAKATEGAYSVVVYGATPAKETLGP